MASKFSSSDESAPDLSLEERRTRLIQMLRKTEQIKELLRIKFPRQAPLPESKLGRSRNWTIIEPDNREQRIEAERAELESKTAAEIDALHAATIQAQRDRIIERVRLEEEARFFNQPSAAADFDYWAKVEYWSLSEALALLLGKSPDVVTWERVQPYVSESAFAEKYQGLRRLALRALAMNGGQSSLYHPGKVLKWAFEASVEIPLGLVKSLDIAIKTREANEEASKQAVTRASAPVAQPGELHPPAAAAPAPVPPPSDAEVTTPAAAHSAFVERARAAGLRSGEARRQSVQPKHADIRNAAASLQESGVNERDIAAKLAGRFNVTADHIRRVLKKPT